MRGGGFQQNTVDEGDIEFMSRNLVKLGSQGNEISTLILMNIQLFRKGRSTIVFVAIRLIASRVSSHWEIRTSEGVEGVREE